MYIHICEYICITRERETKESYILIEEVFHLRLRKEIVTENLI